MELIMKILCISRSDHQVLIKHNNSVVCDNGGVTQIPQHIGCLNIYTEDSIAFSHAPEAQLSSL